MILLPEKIRIGSRQSILAKAQTNIFVKTFLKKFGVENKNKISLNFFKTTGDKFQELKISELGNKSMFTKEIDDAQLQNKIDVSIHSLKDLPVNLPKGLFIAAVLKREDPRDVIYSNNLKSLSNLNKKTLVGTSSIRRNIQIMKIRPDLVIKPIRGNIETRIKKIDQGEYDAIILAAAGLRRLGLKSNFKAISFSKMVPAVGQGTIAIVVRKRDKKVCEIIKELNHKKTFIETECERIFLRTLDGSCNTPIGGYAVLKKDEIFFEYMASSLDGKRYFRNKKIFSLKNFEEQVSDLGKNLKERIKI